MRHRLIIRENGEPWTECGIRLSEHDTDRTLFDTLIETTVYHGHITCTDCINGVERPALKTDRPSLRIVR